MALTVRLPPTTERMLAQLVRRRRQTRSDVVREAIEYFSATHSLTSDEDSALAAWGDVLGVVDVGQAADARPTGERFADAVRKKARDRRAR